MGEDLCVDGDTSYRRLSDPLQFQIPRHAVAFLALKKCGGAILWGSGGAKTRDVYKEQFHTFTVVNLDNLWSSYRRSIWHVIGRVYEKWSATWGLASPNSRGHGPYATPVETPLSV